MRDTAAFARTYPVVPAQEVFNEHFGRLAQVENWRMFGLQRRRRSSVPSALRNRAAVMRDAKGSGSQCSHRPAGTAEVRSRGTGRDLKTE